MYKEDKATIILSTLTSSFALHDLKDALDIVLLVMSIINLTIVLYVKFKRAKKDGVIDKEEKEDLKDTSKQILNTTSQLINKVKEGGNNGGNAEDRSKRE